MSLDVVDLRAFYDSPLGEVARRLVSRVLRARWESQTTGLRVLGIGYATPYLDDFKTQAERVLAFMPAAQGVIHWPLNGRSASALVDATMMPLPDSAMDRILIIHALETGEHPRDLLEEVWRILAPGGRVIIIAPSRTGLWARLDTTPFGHGHPYSRGQLHDLLQEALFLPIFWGEGFMCRPSSARRCCARRPPSNASPGASLFRAAAFTSSRRPSSSSARSVCAEPSAESRRSLNRPWSLSGPRVLPAKADAVLPRKARQNKGI